MKPVLLGLLLCGCATTHVAEVYFLPADAPSIQRAAEEASRRLGWETEASGSGKFKLTNYSRRPHPELTISAEDNVLHIEGEVTKDLPEAALILRSATEEILTGRHGTPVQERSLWVTGILDVLVPSIGGIYALQGDPSFDSPIVDWRRSFWSDVSSRFVVDAMAGVMLGYFATRRDGFGISPLAIVKPTPIAPIALVSGGVGWLNHDASLA